MASQFYLQSLKLSNIGPGQYLDGRPLDATGMGSDIDAA